MAEFYYIAVNKSDKIKRGSLVATNSEEVSQILSRKGLELVSCQEITGKSSLLELDVANLFRTIAYRKISTLEKISFVDHLAVMLKAGVPIVEAVDVLGTDILNPRLRKIIKRLSSYLESGKTVSSLLENEDFFSKAHIAILKAGETSGDVEGSLERIATDLKRDYQITKKVRGAMTYPAVITLALFLISGFILVFVLPKVGEVFKQMNLDIPKVTEVLLTVGVFTNEHFLQVIAGIIAASGIIVVTLKMTDIGTKFLHKVISMMPIIKKLVRQISMARFIRTLSSLLASGVPVAQSIGIAGDVFVSQNYKNIMKDAVTKVEKGVSLTNILRGHKRYFDGALIKMCSVGEKSGNLADILKQMAVFYEREIDDRLENISTIVEPLLMLLVGFGVGAMVLSIIGPIYQMIGSLTQ